MARWVGRHHMHRKCLVQFLVRAHAQLAGGSLAGVLEQELIDASLSHGWFSLPLSLPSSLKSVKKQESEGPGIFMPSVRIALKVATSVAAPRWPSACCSLEGELVLTQKGKLRLREAEQLAWSHAQGLAWRQAPVPGCGSVTSLGTASPWHGLAMAW